MKREEWIENFNFNSKIDDEETWVNIMPMINELFDHIEAQAKELNKYIEVFKPLNTNAVGMLIDSNKELKRKFEDCLVGYDDYEDKLMTALAENKELKEKHRQRKAQAKRLLGNSTQVSQAQEEKIKDLQAKLEDIESSKVAKFSGKVMPSKRFSSILEHPSELVWVEFDSNKHDGEHYTVTISKDNKNG